MIRYIDEVLNITEGDVSAPSEPTMIVVEQPSVAIPEGHVLLQDSSGVPFFTTVRMYNQWYKSNSNFTLLAESQTTKTYLLTNQTINNYENLDRHSRKIIARITGGCGTCGGRKS